MLLLVTLLSFSIGVYSGKSLSDSDYQLAALRANEFAAEKFAQNGNLEREAEGSAEAVTEADIDRLSQEAVQAARAELADSQARQPSSEKAPVAAAPAPEKSEETKAAPTATTKTETKKDAVKEAATQIASGKAPAEPASAKEKSRVPNSLPNTVGQDQVEYTVQVASYPKKDEAEKHCAELIQKGFPAFPVAATVNGQTWYRVSIGSFKEVGEAQSYRQQVVSQGAAKTAIVQKIGRVARGAASQN